MLGRSTWQGVRGAGALGMVALQLVAGAALPSADAVLEAERIALPTHVESPHNEDCPSAHDHLFCQVVRSLAAASGGRGAGQILAIATPRPDGLRPSQRNDAVARPPVRGPYSPRPPPLG